MGDEGQKGCLPVSCFGPKDEMSASTTSGREKTKKRLTLNQQHLSELRATFVLFDKDGSGDIDVREFGMMMSTLGVRLAPKIVTLMFDEMDHSKDGRVEFDEFVEYMVTHGFTSRAETDGPTEIVDCVFEMLDGDRSGTISAAELRTMMSSFSENNSEHEMDVAMQMFDLDGTGTITKSEFVKAIEMMHTFPRARRKASAGSSPTRRASLSWLPLSLTSMAIRPTPRCQVTRSLVRYYTCVIKRPCRFSK